MGCCEKEMIERLKVLSHASVLACQEANIRNVTIAVVKLIHQHYGEYYKGILIEDAREQKLHIFRKFKPGDTMAVQNSNRNR